jgi:hypothetical protein
MPIAVIILGVLLIDLAFRGTEHETAQLLAADFGQGSKFWTWAAALGIVGALGYAQPLRGVSTALLSLIIVGMILANGGLFTQLAQVIQNPPQARPAISITSYASVVFGSKVSGEVSADVSGPALGTTTAAGAAVPSTDPVPVLVVGG